MPIKPRLGVCELVIVWESPVNQNSDFLLVSDRFEWNHVGLSARRAPFIDV